MAAAGESLRGHAALPSARFVARAVMHVTLRFLGDVDEERAAKLAATAARFDGRAAFAVRATGLAAFPRAAQARVLVAELDDGGASAAIARELEESCVALGFPQETRAFRPHLTIARLREPKDVRRVVAETPLASEGAARSVTLYASVLGKDGPTYTPVARGVLKA